MSWNYRVVKRLLLQGNPDYAVYEVYYDKFGHPDSITCNDVSPAGENKDEFGKSLALWNRSLEKPVLIFDTVTEKFVGEEPPIVPPPCPDCGRPMVRREPWTCATCGEECEL